MCWDLSALRADAIKLSGRDGVTPAGIQGGVGNPQNRCSPSRRRRSAPFQGTKASAAGLKLHPHAIVG